MAAPSMWAPAFWTFMLHVAGQVAGHDPKQLTKEEQEEIEYFFTHVCNYLLCGNCINHCNRYVQVEKPPHFETRQDIWQYAFEFHNSVNQRQQKVQPNETEALILLQQNYQFHGVEWTNLTHQWIFEYWFILKLSMITMLHQPGNPSPTLTFDKLYEWWKWVRSCCFIWPFAYHTPQTRDLLIEWIDHVDLHECKTPYDVDHLLVQFQQFIVSDSLGMLNQPASKFISTEQFVQQYNAKFDWKQITLFNWANQRLEEANKKMYLMQQELNQWKQPNTTLSQYNNNNKIDNKTDNNNKMMENIDWRILSYCMMSLSVLLLITLVIVFLYYRFYLSCSRSVSKSSHHMNIKIPRDTSNLNPFQ
jgi:hypothetical protein